MKARGRWCGLAVVAWMAISIGANLAAEGPVWKVGLAKARITPQKPFWMAGFSARTRPAEGAMHDLWIKVWKLGRRQLWITMGGEVAVDYSLLFKKNYGPRTWVAGYTNDVMAYIPSRRIWEEGGYQAGAFEVYGMPAVRWSADIETRIVDRIDRLVKEID